MTNTEVFAIDDLTFELFPKSDADKKRKLEQIAKLSPALIPRLSVNTLRNLATGILSNTRAKKADLAAALVEATKVEREKQAALAVNAFAELTAMNIDMDSVMQMIDVNEPNQVADLMFNSLLTRNQASTISKTITPELRKLLRTHPNQERALEFDRRWMELVRPLTKSLNSAQQSAVAIKHHDQKASDYLGVLEFAKAYITDAAAYVRSTDEATVRAGKKIVWQAVVFSLIIATGRRQSEIQSTVSTFTAMEGFDDRLMFANPAKAKLREVKPFFIPTLVSASDCLDALKYLEIIGKREDITHDRVNPKYAKPCSVDMRKDLRERLTELGVGKTHDGRRFYGSYFAELFMQDPNRPNMSVRAFLSRLLGHGDTDINTGSSYEVFRVKVDDPALASQYTQLWQDMKNTQDEPDAIM
jgi:hypothetical protein